jgi:hypothetical protein
MEPISGPFTKSWSIAGPELSSGARPTDVEGTRVWFRQSKPFNLPLEFQLTKKVRVSRWSYENSAYVVLAPPTQVSWMVAEAHDKAYDAFRNRCGDYSQWATNLIEANQTISMIAARASQLFRAAKALKKGRFGDFLGYLGVSRVNRKIKRHKQFADNWLEYAFAWKPAVQDIGAGVEALCTDFSPKRVFGRGRSLSNDSYHLNISGPDFGGFHNVEDILYQWETIVRIGASIRIVNPNIHLLDQLGFINPLSVAWEAVPFSFVLDWVSNVGQVLQSVTDFLGLEILHSFTTVYTQTEKSTYQMYEYTAHPEWYSSQKDRQRGFYVKRNPGFSGPEFRLKPFKGFSVARGTTAVALLLQFLSGQRPTGRGR